MDSTEQLFEPNLEKVISGTSLDRAFVLSCNESLLQTVMSDTEITTDNKSLSGEFPTSNTVLSTDNELYDTSYLAFPDLRNKSNVSDTKEETVYSKTCSLYSDSVNESCSRYSAVASDIEDSPDKVKEPSLSEIILHMIDTILKNGPKKTDTSTKVATSISSIDPSPVAFEINSISRSDQITTSPYFSPSSQTIERSIDIISNNGDSSRMEPELQLHTILEGTCESASNLSNADSENWSRMYVGKLNSVTPHVNVKNDNVTYKTRESKEWNQTDKDTIPDITLSGVETSLSFETHDEYHDTFDNSFQLCFEENCPSEYTSASELSIVEDNSESRMSDITFNTSTLGHSNDTQSITSRISEKLKKIRFSFSMRNGDSQRSVISSGTERESLENHKKINKPSKSHSKKVKSKKRLSGSLSDIGSVLVSSCDTSGKDGFSTPTRLSKYYSPQKTPQCTQSAKKNSIRKNQNWTRNSPRLSSWGSPAVVTSPIKPVRFLRNLFNELELKNRGLNYPRSSTMGMKKRLATPKIFITPPSPLSL